VVVAVVAVVAFPANVVAVTVPVPFTLTAQVPAVAEEAATQIFPLTYCVIFPLAGTDVP
jgi:hypothetical protein